MSFPRYPKYKASGVEWLGDVPENWRIDRLKWSIAHSRNGVWGEEPRQDQDDIPCVRVADFDRLKLRVELDEPTIRNVTARDRDGRVLKFGDLLLEKSGGGESQPVGCVVRYEDERPAVCSNFVARLVPAADTDSSYWRYVHSAAYDVRLTTASINQTSGIQNLDQQRYFDERVAFPEWTEQQTIAAFLDRETAKIDALVAEQERLIELLKEKRQSVISHAVTKGLDLAAPMKPSDIEWLGEVPAHWGISQFKRLAGSEPKSFVDGDWIESPYITYDGIRLLQTGNIGIGVFKEQGGRYISDTTFEELGCTEVFPNDVLICRLDGPVGRACLAPNIGDRMVTSVDNAIVKCGNHVDPRFVVALLSSGPWLAWIDALCRVGGGFRLRVSRTQLGDLRVPLPPIAEQQRISEFLDSEITSWNRLMQEAQNAINLLHERRAALISAAVTGQIDVRNAVPVESA